MAQGWQLAKPVQLLGISSVEAIANQARHDGLRGPVNVLVDAQRGEFYLAGWELSETLATEVESLRIVTRDVVESLVNAGGLLVGPEVTKCFPSGRNLYPRAADLAELAIARADFVAGDQLEPIYLRETTFVKAPPPREV